MVRRRTSSPAGWGRSGDSRPTRASTTRPRTPGRRTPGRSGGSPLKPVTRRQFLEAYLAATQVQLDAMVADIDRSGLDPARKAAAAEQRREQLSQLQAPARARLSA